MQIITRDEAKSSGLMYYHTGNPCKHGHDSERYAKSGQCVQCMRDKSNKWRKDNPEQAKERDRQYHSKNTEKISIKRAQYRAENSDALNAWKREYYQSEAGKLERQKYREKNAERIRDRKREYYHANIEQEREAKRRDYIKHKDKRLASMKEYSSANRDKINEYFRNRRKTDLKFKLSTYMRNMVGRLVNRGYDKTKLTSEILGYDVNQLKSHISEQFKDGMSWDNYGEWHIDHIVPIVQMVNRGVKDPAIVNALDNLQPLWAFDNLSKGGR